jgi:hypothetical protein
LGLALQKEELRKKPSSVADPRIFIPDPDFLLSRISDSTRAKRGGENLCPTFFCRHKFHKIVNYFISKKVQENLIKFTQNSSILNPKKLLPYYALRNMGL